MLKNTRLQMLLVLVAGAGLGYGAAAGWLPSFRSATAAPPPAAAAAAAAQCGAEGCCSEGVSKASLGSTTGQAEEAEEVIEFELLVPAGAVVLIDGEKTTETGAVRHYQTPPLPTGKHYAYTVTVLGKGREVKRKIGLAHGKTNRFDLRTNTAA